MNVRQRLNAAIETAFLITLLVGVIGVNAIIVWAIRGLFFG